MTYCDVRDVAAGIIAAVERGQTGRRYILGGEPLSFLDAFHFDRQYRLASRPRGGNGGGRFDTASGLSPAVQTRLTGVEPEYNSAAIAISELPHHFSYARAAAELGYTVRPAREAVQAAWDWFVEHGYAKRRALSTNTKAH